MGGLRQVNEGDGEWKTEGARSYLLDLIDLCGERCYHGPSATRPACVIYLTEAGRTQEKAGCFGRDDSFMLFVCVCASAFVEKKGLGRRAYLTREGGKVEIDAAGLDFSGCEIVFVEGAAGYLHGFVGSGDVGKSTLVNGIEAPFDGDKIAGVGEISNGVYVSGEGRDEWDYEGIPDGGFSRKLTCGKVQHDVVGVIAENLVGIDPFPGVEIFLDECSYVFQ